MSNKWTWKTAHQDPGAGIIIVKQISNEWKILGMWSRGGYDIPKGHTEENESALETAIRECQEEVNIKNLKFTYTPEDIFKKNIYIITVPTPLKKNNVPDLSFLKAVGLKGIQGQEMVPLIALKAVGADGWTTFLSILIFMSVSSSLSITIQTAGARVIQAMGKQGVFFQFTAKLNNHYKTRLIQEMFF